MRASVWSLLEAMSQRLPVISTPAGCAATLVRDGETGYRIPPRDAAALVGGGRPADGESVRSAAASPTTRAPPSPA